MSMTTIKYIRYLITIQIEDTHKFYNHISGFKGDRGTTDYGQYSRIDTGLSTFRTAHGDCRVIGLDLTSEEACVMKLSFHPCHMVQSAYQHNTSIAKYLSEK